MIYALAVAALVFVLSFLAISALAAWWHHWRESDQPARYYWGIIIFSVLLAAYAFATNLGR